MQDSKLVKRARMFSFIKESSKKQNFKLHPSSSFKLDINCTIPNIFETHIKIDKILEEKFRDLGIRFCFEEKEQNKSLISKAINNHIKFITRTNLRNILENPISEENCIQVIDLIIDEYINDNSIQEVFIDLIYSIHQV